MCSGTYLNSPKHMADFLGGLYLGISSSKTELNRGWCIKNATGTLWHFSKTVNPRVKAQARGQNNRSRALKWGIVHFCSSNTFEDMIMNKKCHFS